MGLSRRLLLRFRLLSCSLLLSLCGSLSRFGLLGGGCSLLSGGGLLSLCRLLGGGRSLLGLLLGLLKGEAAELEGGLLEGEALLLLLAFFARGCGALFCFGRSLSVCGGGLLLAVGLSALYLVTVLFGRLFSGSAAIGLDVGLVGVLSSRRGISIGLGMTILLRAEGGIKYTLTATQCLPVQ